MAEFKIKLRGMNNNFEYNGNDYEISDEHISGDVSGINNNIVSIILERQTSAVKLSLISLPMQFMLSFLSNPYYLCKLYIKTGASFSLYYAGFIQARKSDKVSISENTIDVVVDSPIEILSVPEFFGVSYVAGEDGGERGFANYIKFPYDFEDTGFKYAVIRPDICNGTSIEGQVFLGRVPSVYFDESEIDGITFYDIKHPVYTDYLEIIEKSTFKGIEVRKKYGGSSFVSSYSDMMKRATDGIVRLKDMHTAVSKGVVSKDNVVHIFDYDSTDGSGFDVKYPALFNIFSLYRQRARNFTTVDMTMTSSALVCKDLYEKWLPTEANYGDGRLTPDGSSVWLNYSKLDNSNNKRLLSFRNIGDLFSATLNSMYDNNVKIRDCISFSSEYETYSYAEALSPETKTLLSISDIADMGLPLYSVKPKSSSLQEFYMFFSHTYIVDGIEVNRLFFTTLNQASERSEFKLFEIIGCYTVIERFSVEIDGEDIEDLPIPYLLNNTISNDRIYFSVKHDGEDIGKSKKTMSYNLHSNKLEHKLVYNDSASYDDLVAESHSKRVIWAYPKSVQGSSVWDVSITAKNLRSDGDIGCSYYNTVRETEVINNKKYNIIIASEIGSAFSRNNFTFANDIFLNKIPVCLSKKDSNFKDIINSVCCSAFSCVEISFDDNADKFNINIRPLEMQVDGDGLSGIILPKTNFDDLLLNNDNVIEWKLYSQDFDLPKVISDNIENNTKIDILFPNVTGLNGTGAQFNARWLVMKDKVSLAFAYENNILTNNNIRSFTFNGDKYIYFGYEISGSSIYLSGKRLIRDV
jgi:hypothetical protein